MRRSVAPVARLLLVSLLIAAPAVAAPVARRAAPAPRPGGLAVIQGVTYDPAHQALAVPFMGGVPTYELHQLTPTRAYFELRPARFAGLYSLHTPGGGPFNRVTMANRPEGNAVRLSFYTTRPGKPELVWDRAHRRLLITLGAATGVVAPTAAPTPAATAAPGAHRSPGAPHSPAPTPHRSAAPMPHATPTPQAMSGHGRTTIRSVYFDNARGLLVLPFSGAIPTYSLAQPEAGALAIDFANSTLAKAGTIRQDLEHHPLLRRWTAQEIADANPPATRVLLSLASSAEVGVAHDPSLGAMLVIPEPLADSSPLPASAPRTKTRLATPVFDPRTSELTLTFAGRVPSFSVLRPTPTTAYVDLPGVELIAGSMPFERVDLNPLLTFWLLAGRPAIEGQRLIMHLPFGGELRVSPEPAAHKLVVKVMAPEPSMPTPAPATSPEATPAVPLTPPTAAPSPAAMTPGP